MGHSTAKGLFVIGSMAIWIASGTPPDKVVFFISIRFMSRVLLTPGQLLLFNSSMSAYVVLDIYLLALLPKNLWAGVTEV